MRKDSINNDALEKAYLIFKEHGHQTVDFSHSPTDYARGTVLEPESTSKLKEAFNELSPANLMNGERYETLDARSKALDVRIDAQQEKLRICRLRGNFQEFHRCLKEIQEMIKEKERLDAEMAVAAPGGNVGQKQMDDYNRTYDQDDFSEMKSLGERISELENLLLQYAETEVEVEVEVKKKGKKDDEDEDDEDEDDEDDED